MATPETEDRLLKIARTGTAAHVEQIVGAWRRMDRKAEAEESARQLKGRGLQIFTDEDGMMVIRGRLTPEVGAVLLRALDAARERQYQQSRTDAIVEPPTFAQQQADALGLVAEAALHQEFDPGAPGERYQVIVHVDAAVLADPDQPGQAAFEDGVRASAEPCMWLSPLPVPLKLVCSRTEEPRSITLLVPHELDAEPDPGRFEVPRHVDTAVRAVITD